MESKIVQLKLKLEGSGDNETQDVVTKSDLANGRANRLDPQDRSFHDWYRFVLSYPPHLVRNYINKFQLTPGS